MFDRCRNAERPECRPTGLTTMSRCQVMVIAVWLGSAFRLHTAVFGGQHSVRSALRQRPTAREYCNVCLLFITAPSSLFPRHLIRPDYRVITINPTAASDSCTWRRRDVEVRKTFAFYLSPKSAKCEYR